MRSQYILTVVTAGTIILAAGSAQSVTFDFLQAIDNGYDGTITMDGTGLSDPTGELGGSELVWVKDGLTLTVTASPSGNSGDYVYLDSGSAGVGVCGELNNSKQCNPSSDDNVTTLEWLNFNFDSEVSLDFSSSLFKNANHVTYDPIPSGIWMEVDSSASYNLGVNGNGALSYSGSDFRFWTSSNATQFYVSTFEANPVPEPSTMLLFGAGLAGIAGASSRRRSKK